MAGIMFRVLLLFWRRTVVSVCTRNENWDLVSTLGQTVLTACPLQLAGVGALRGLSHRSTRAEQGAPSSRSKDCSCDGDIVGFTDAASPCSNFVDGIRSGLED